MSKSDYTAAGAEGNSQGTAQGASAPQDIRAGGAEAYGQTEKLRHGINQFFDETLQPSAARDASHGPTAQHKPTSTDPTQNAYTQATTDKPASIKNFGGGHTSLDDLSGTREAMERWKQENKKMHGTGGAPGLDKAPGLSKAPGLDKAPGLSKAPGLRSAPGLSSASGTRAALERMKAERESR